MKPAEARADSRSARDMSRSSQSASSEGYWSRSFMLTAL